jgi:hypothetical protein
MDLLHLVDRLEELVAGAQRMPIGGRAIVDRRRLLDIIDQMRVAIPDEVRQAREIVAQTSAIRRDSEEEARLIVARAEEQTARLLDEHHVTRSARLRAEEIAENAERQLDDRISAANAETERGLDESRRLAEQQMSAADQYAHELLDRLERQLAAFQRSIHSGLEQLSQPLDGADGGELAGPADAAAEAAAVTDPILAATGAAPRSLDEGERRASERLDQSLEGFEAFDSAFAEPHGPPDAPDSRRDPPPHRAHLADLLRGLVPEPEPVPPADPGVIDDFAMPSLDDEPEESPRGLDGAPQRPSNGAL